MSFPFFQGNFTFFKRNFLMTFFSHLPKKCRLSSTHLQIFTFFAIYAYMSPLSNLFIDHDISRPTRRPLRPPRPPTQNLGVATNQTPQDSRLWPPIDFNRLG